MNHEQPAPKKALGQHWLDDPYSLEAICASADVSKNDVVLEIGPGLGSLTKILTREAKKVIAVELDKRLAESLKNKVSSDKLEVVQASILDYDLDQLGDYKIVANIPYYLTNNLIRYISESTNPPSVASLLVQKEVAERISAGPGKMSVLSVTAQFFWEVEPGQIVEAYLFTPPPKVDSQIITLVRRKKLPPKVETEVFFRLVRAGFSQKRKTLLNSLSAGLKTEKSYIEAACKQVNIDSKRRAQTLSMDEWLKLYHRLT